MIYQGRASGFTLIEVLVSVVILSVGIVLILQAFSTAAVALGASRTASRSCYLIQKKMDDIQADSVLGRIEEGYSSGGFDGAFNNFVWRSAIEENAEISNDLPARIYKVIIKVVEERTDHEMEAVTYVSVPQKHE